MTRHSWFYDFPGKQITERRFEETCYLVTEKSTKSEEMKAADRDMKLKAQVLCDFTDSNTFVAGSVSQMGTSR